MSFREHISYEGEIIGLTVAHEKEFDGTEIPGSIVSLISQARGIRRLFLKPLMCCLSWISLCIDRPSRRISEARLDQEN
jgi:hypothetical protein